MTYFASIALTAFVLVQSSLPAGPAPQTTAGPLAREHWQRVLTAAAGREGVEQCVVLDAELFATAAPGLRDLRLLQGERELPYAVDESHDERETRLGMPVDDRSVFDVVGTVPLVRSSTGGMASFVVPAHVPVERITLRGALDRAVDMTVRAMPRSRFAGAKAEAEVVRLQARAGQPSIPVTLGANLQHAAEVEVTVTPGSPGLTGVAFEMRRRELCYKPVTTAAVRMVYGDSEAELIHYDYALHYTPTATPLLASVGPRETNPLYAAPAPAQAILTVRQKLEIAIGLCVAMIAVTFGALAGMLRKQR